MLNRYPFWKYLLILAIAALGLTYAAPNLYSPDPAIQVSGQSAAMEIDDKVLKQATDTLDKAGITYFGQQATGKNALIRLDSANDQLRAKEALTNGLGHDYVVALSQAATTPAWLRGMGAEPMKKGLDLAGGVHFLLEVDTPKAIEKRLQSDTREIGRQLRKEKIKYQSNKLGPDNVIVIRFKTAELRDKAASLVASSFSQLTRSKADLAADSFALRLAMSEAAIREVEDYAVSQNLTTLRNRVNEIGVSEPIVQRQGRTRIVVQLPGLQDPAEAKRIIGKTANLEFRLEAKPDASVASKERFEYRSEKDQAIFGGADLERRVVITGDMVTG
ncbi:MAG: protein translocase subunit SecD, partial [Cellvibrionaceae bacterium]|nr:protein translocase subunit SecD [Cellvibrionaceae bacterium]